MLDPTLYSALTTGWDSPAYVTESESIGSGVPPRAAPDSSATWTFIWCHERCYKADNEAPRQTIRAALEPFGAPLILLKKARQFMAWTQKEDLPEYILATDWREAKPCMDVLSKDTGCKPPMIIAVICDSERQAARAKEWVQELGLWSARVFVCHCSSVSHAVLGGIFHRCFGSAGTEAAASPAVLASPPGLHRITGAQSFTCPAGLDDIGDDEVSQELKFSLSLCSHRRVNDEPIKDEAFGLGWRQAGLPGCFIGDSNLSDSCAAISLPFYGTTPGQFLDRTANQDSVPGSSVSSDNSFVGGIINGSGILSCGTDAEEVSEKPWVNSGAVGAGLGGSSGVACEAFLTQTHIMVDANPNSGPDCNDMPFPTRLWPS